MLLELNSEDVFAKRLKAIIASFNHPIKTVADILMLIKPLSPDGQTGLAFYEKGRTPVKLTVEFKNFYLYSSVNSADGSSFTLLLQSVNTDC